MGVFNPRGRRFFLVGALVCMAPLIGGAFPWTEVEAHSTEEDLQLGGMYKVQTTFSTGPQAGQTVEGIIQFGTDYTVMSTYPSKGLKGNGRWWVTANDQIQYSFREIFPDGSGDVQVVHIVTQLTQYAFTSCGVGIIYSPQGIAVAIADTVNQAKRYPG